MPFDRRPFFERQRRLASQIGLALLVLSPLFFYRPLEDAYVLPQRLAALLGLALAFASLPEEAISRSKLLWWALLYFTWRLLTHAMRGFSLAWLIEQMVPLGALVLAAQAARQKAWRERAWALAGLSALLVSAYALLLLWGLDPWDRGAVDMGFLHRAHGSLGNPDFLAGFLVLLTPGLVVAWCLDRRGGLGRGLSLGVVLAALLLTHVRGAWLAALASIGVALYLARPGLSRKKMLTLGGLVLVLGLGLSAPSRLSPSGQTPWARLRSAWSGDGAWAGRRFMAQVGVNIALAHPWVGVGPGHFQNAFLEEQGRLLGQAAYAKEPYRFTADIHDDWVQALAESGWIGLGSLLFLVAAAIHGAWRKGGVEGAAMAGLFTAFSVQALFHFPLSIQASALVFWGALGWVSSWEIEPPGPAWPALDWAWACLPLGLGLVLTGRQTLASAALNSGTVLRDAGRPVEAAALFERAARLWPEDSRAWMRWGLAQDAAGRTEDSVRSFERATRVLPGLPEAWTNLGLALGKLDQLAAAQAVSEQALALNPRSPEAWSNLAKLRYLQGDAADAVKDLQGGLDQAGPSSLLYFNLGAVYLNTGRRREAKEAFEQCLRLQPDHVEAKRQLAGLQHVP